MIPLRLIALYMLKIKALVAGQNSCACIPRLYRMRQKEQESKAI